MSAVALSWAERRRFPRVSLPPALGPASLGTRDGRRPAATVLDFSPGGVSLPAEQLELVKDDAPLSLRVAGREFECAIRDERRRQAGMQAQERGRVGVPLAFHPVVQRDVAEFYHRLRFPFLRRRGDLIAEDVCRLFADSGYLSLRPGLEPDEAWTRAQWPRSLSHEAVFQDEDGQALGHISVTRAYRNAWIGHEIAMLPRSEASHSCRRDLYQHFCVWPRLLDGEETHVFGYYNPKRRFHQQMFEAFAGQSAVADCTIVRMDRYMPVEHAPGWCLDASQEALDVRVLDGGDDEEVLDLIAQYWPTLARTAFDLAPGALVQASLHQQFAEIGAERSRTCLVLRAAGRLIAAVLCEWDQTRLSLFDVLSVAHVFVVPGVAVTGAIEAAIEQAIRRFYAERGLRVPLFTCPPNTFGRRDLPGFRWAETMACIVFSSRALRAFETYVELTLDTGATITNVAPSATLGRGP